MLSKYFQKHPQNISESMCTKKTSAYVGNISPIKFRMPYKEHDWQEWQHELTTFVRLNICIQIFALLTKYHQHLVLFHFNEGNSLRLATN